MAGPAGTMSVEQASARFEMSDKDVLIRDLTINLNGAMWWGSGTVGSGGELTGLIVGRVPVSDLGGGGSALSLVAGLLADGEGKVPVAFRVSGTVSRAVLSFDLDAVVQEAANAGRPQAKSLLNAMSKSDRERLRSTVEELLKGLTVR
jgi:hypothetical protein